jgi:hypothetical protein
MQVLLCDSAHERSIKEEKICEVLLMGASASPAGDIPHKKAIRLRSSAREISYIVHTHSRHGGLGSEFRALDLLF